MVVDKNLSPAAAPSQRREPGGNSCERVRVGHACNPQDLHASTDEAVSGSAARDRAGRGRRRAGIYLNLICFCYTDKDI